MLYVTGADWFCMCDRAGPEAPAVGEAQKHRPATWGLALLTNLSWLPWVWLLWHISSFSSTYKQLGVPLPVLVNQCTSSLQHGLAVILTDGPLTPYVGHSPTHMWPTLMHCVFFSLQFPCKWLLGHLRSIYQETKVSVFPVHEIRQSMFGTEEVFIYISSLTASPLSWKGN